jgi:hypothetical protein
MKLSTVCPVVALSILLCAYAVTAQDKHEHQHDSLEEVGQVHFPISCVSSVRDQFNRSVAMLHSFWYEEAEKAFAAIADKDPNCAMAYWGIAMSLYHPLWGEAPNAAAMKKGLAAVEKAKAAGAKTARERDYITAIEVFYKDSDKLDHATRALAYEKAMGRVQLHYPRDREAALFHALALIATAPPGDKTYANQKKAARLLDQVYAKEPNHPGVAHYFIHAYDYPPLAHLALNAARRYAKIAPSVPHALHMPSHIFTRLGLWQESIQSNLASKAAAEQYSLKALKGSAWDEQLHAMDYLMYAYLQGAQDNEAKRILDELNAIQKAEPENLKVAYAFAAIPARYALERRRWMEAASLKLRPEPFPWNRYLWPEANLYFARAIGEARGGHPSDAGKDLERIQTFYQAAVEAKQKPWLDQIEILRRAAGAWVAHAEGNNQEALDLMRSAADLEDSIDKQPVTPGSILPMRELLGDLLIELNQPKQALDAYETSLRGSPNRFNGLYGAARAAALSGDKKKARALYAKLLAVCDHADGDRPEILEARAFLANN